MSALRITPTSLTTAATRGSVRKPRKSRTWLSAIARLLDAIHGYSLFPVGGDGEVAFLTNRQILRNTNTDDDYLPPAFSISRITFTKIISNRHSSWLLVVGD